MKKTYLLYGIAIIVLLSGCSANLKNVQPVGIKNLELAPLTSSEYEIVKDVTGKATVTTILMFIRIEGRNNYGFLASNLGMMTTTDLAKSNAIYNAINSNEGIDALLCPKFTMKSTGIPLLYSKTTVTVKGKGIKIK